MNENLCGHNIMGILGTVGKPEKITKTDKDRAHSPSQAPAKLQLAPLVYFYFVLCLCSFMLLFYSINYNNAE